jgi:hypothetical protein
MMNQMSLDAFLASPLVQLNLVGFAGNNMVVLPNSFLAKLGPTNISRPDETHFLTLIVRVAPTRMPSIVVDAGYQRGSSGLRLDLKVHTRLAGMGEFLGFSGPNREQGEGSLRWCWRSERSCQQNLSAWDFKGLE